MNWIYFLIVIGLSSLESNCVFSISEIFFKSSNEAYGSQIVSEFGMSRGATVSIDYNVQASHSLNSFNSYVLVLIYDLDGAKMWYSKMSGSSSDIQNNINTLCTQPSLYRKQIFGSGNLEYTIPDDAMPSQFSLSILQCRSTSNNLPISVSATVKMMNPSPYSSSLSHLPIEDVVILRVLAGEIIVYCLLLASLVFQLITSKPWIKKIHYFFLISIVTQILSLIAQYSDYIYFNENGTEPDSLQYFDNITAHVNSLVVLLTILLLSLGWSTVRVQLTPREVRLATGALSCYFIAGMLAAACLESTNDLCQSLDLITYVLRTLVFLGIIIAMNFTVSHLKATLIHSPWGWNVPSQYIQARRYQLFRIAFIVYLLAPTAVLLIEGALFTWKQDWITFTLNEMIVLLMFFHVGVNFSPVHENLMSRAFDGTYNAVHAE